MSEAAMEHGHHMSAEEVARSNDNQKFAMWLYLASEIAIFSIFIGAYVIFRVREPEAVRAFHKGLGVTLVTINTFILLVSSWAMVMGLRAMQHGNRRGMLRWISLTAILGTVFLAGQYIEYRELANVEITLQHATISENNELLHALDLENVEAAREALGGFGMRFYVPTAFHGAHVLVGVLWALLVLWRGRKGRYDHNPVGIEVFGLYWHFVDVVWVLLFTLIYLI